MVSVNGWCVEDNWTVLDVIPNLLITPNFNKSQGTSWLFKTT